MKKFIFCFCVFFVPVYCFSQIYNELNVSRDEIAAKDFIATSKIKSITKKKFWPDSMKNSYNSYDDFSITEKYDILGNLTEYNSTYNVFNVSKNSYSYLDDKLINKKTSYSNSNGQWITETTYKYNGKGKLTGKNEVFSDVYGKKVTSEQTVFYYDKDDRPVKSNIYDTDSVSGKVITAITFNYDVSGNLTEETQENSEGVTDKKFIYTYDKSNRLLSMKYFLNSSEKTSKEYGYIYGQNNDTVMYYEKKLGYAATDTTYYTYDEKKRIASEFYNTPSGPDHALYTYDFTGLLYEITEFINYRKKTTRYSYDANNLQTLILVLDENDRYLWGKEIIYEYYY